jgi:hypothetical protein
MIAFLVWAKGKGVVLLGIAQCPIKLVRGQPIKLFQERGKKKLWAHP